MAAGDGGAVRSASITQLNFGAHGDEQVALRLNVAHVRDIFQDDRLVGEQGGGHRGQCGILGAANADAAHQGIATTNYKFIHKTLWPKGHGSKVNPYAAAA